MVIGLARSTTGLLYVAEILDEEIGMSLQRVTDRRAGPAPETIPQTRWMHPVTMAEYRHRNGNLYQLIEGEKEVKWSYKNSSQQLLKSS